MIPKASKTIIQMVKIQVVIDLTDIRETQRLTLDKIILYVNIY